MGLVAREGEHGTDFRNFRAVYPDLAVATALRWR